MQHKKKTHWTIWIFFTPQHFPTPKRPNANFPIPPHGRVTPTSQRRWALRDPDGFFVDLEIKDQNYWWKKSCEHQLRLVVYPIIYKVLAPSQVVSRISSINSMFIRVYRYHLSCFETCINMYISINSWFRYNMQFLAAWHFFLGKPQVFHSYLECLEGTLQATNILCPWNQPSYSQIRWANGVQSPHRNAGRI